MFISLANESISLPLRKRTRRRLSTHSGIYNGGTNTLHETSEQFSSIIEEFHLHDFEVLVQLTKCSKIKHQSLRSRHLNDIHYYKNRQRKSNIATDKNVPTS
ncbi:hypothetical protein HanRHA438_Chr02g0092641 [Helianthus annuus]|nr:hypothetical protein HanRHA438_Chr02g0092641 [Helianthus annuus]